MEPPELPSSRFNAPFQRLMAEKYPVAITPIFIREDNLQYDKDVIVNLARTINYDIKDDVENAGFKRIDVYGLSTGRFILEISVNKEEFHVGYSSDYYYTARYSEDDGGMLDIDALLTKRNGKIRHPYMPHSSELFQLALEYYAKQGLTINAVAGVWPKRFAQRTNINFKAFKDALARGLPPEEAVFETPQGKIVKKHGFTRCVFADENTQDFKGGLTVTFFRTSNQTSI